MQQHSPNDRRWRRSGAATAALLGILLATGCSGSQHRVASTPSASPSSTTPPTAGPTAAQSLGRALGATRAVRSYSFRATQSLTGGAHPKPTTIVGRAIRPSSVAYTLTSGTASQQVVRLGTRIYRRTPPAGWALLTKPVPSVDPLSSLLTLLPGIEHASLTGTTIRGTVAARVLLAAGLAPVGARAGAAAPVTLTLDGSGRVTTLTLQLIITAKSHRLVLTETTTFSGFDAAPAIVRPIR